MTIALEATMLVITLVGLALGLGVLTWLVRELSGHLRLR